MFKGNLKTIPLIHLLQLFSQEKKSGVILLNNMEEKIGEIFLKEGFVIAAKYKNLKGKKAFFKLINFKSGEFIFKENVALPKQEIHLTCEQLLLDALRYQDELKNIQQKITDQFKGRVIKVNKVPWENLWSLLLKSGEILESGDLGYLWGKEKNQPYLIVEKDKEVFKIELAANERLDNIAHEIISFIQGI